jgi:hypothetical protein
MNAVIMATIPPISAKIPSTYGGYAAREFLFTDIIKKGDDATKKINEDFFYSPSERIHLQPS